jgi:KAP family P-loop domain
MKFLEDIPEEGMLRFDVEEIAEALTPFLFETWEGAAILGLHGDWGTGKTTLMKAIAKSVHGEFAKKAAGLVEPVFVEFNAWKYHEREALWRALILRIIGALRSKAEAEGWAQEKGDLDELDASLYRAFEVQTAGPWKVNWQIAVTELLRLALGVIHLDFVADAIRSSTGWIGKLLLGKPKQDDHGRGEKDNGGDGAKELAGLFERTTVTRHVDQVESIEQFLETYRKLVRRLNDRGCRLFILVDDLDRCLPEDALQVFEAIKLFLDAPGCGFVVALDREVIRKGLAVRYGRSGEYGRGQNFIDPDQYIEKTISLSFDLPRLSPVDIRSLIDSAKLGRPLADKQKSLVASALGPNPRRIKRFMNTLGVQLELAQAAKRRGRAPPPWLEGPGPDEDWQFTWFVKLTLISYRYTAITALLIGNVELLKRLNGIAVDYCTRKTKEPDQARKTLLDKISSEPPAILAQQDNDDFWDLMSLAPSMVENDSGFKEVAEWFRSCPPAKPAKG